MRVYPMGIRLIGRSPEGRRIALQKTVSHHPCGEGIEALTMRVSADRQFGPLFHSDLHQGRLLADDVQNRLDDLERELAMDLLPVLESLDHVVDKLLGHLVTQPDPVVAVIDDDLVDVQILERGGRVPDFNRLLKLETAHQLLAFRKLQLGLPVVWLPLDNGSEVLEGFAGVEDGSVGERPSPIRLQNDDISACGGIVGALKMSRKWRLRTLTYPGSSSIALVASAIA